MNTNTSDTPSGYTVASLGSLMRARLEPRFGKRETQQMERIIWQSLKGWNLTDLIMKSDSEVSLFIYQKVTDIISKVLAGQPIQYVLGEANFYGMTLKVTPATLIPRPETAELVDLIVDRYKGRSDMRVLDIGTGSGCIAIALARNLPFAQVTALDISQDALAVAQSNAATLKAKVNFINADILSAPLPTSPCYDIIVSNPPYIAMHEKAEMEPTVTDHEPSTALFVPDSNPLLFYKAILHYATAALTPGGMVFFEINPLFASELKEYADQAGVWRDTTLCRDMQGRLRFLYATFQP